MLALFHLCGLSLDHLPESWKMFGAAALGILVRLQALSCLGRRHSLECCWAFQDDPPGFTIHPLEQICCTLVEASCFGCVARWERCQLLVKSVSSMALQPQSLLCAVLTTGFTADLNRAQLYIF